jgi:hypothetical protein
MGANAFMKSQTISRYEVKLRGLRDRLRGDIQRQVDIVPQPLHAPGGVTDNRR